MCSSNSSRTVFSVSLTHCRPGRVLLCRPMSWDGEILPPRRLCRLMLLILCRLLPILRLVHYQSRDTSQYEQVV